MIKSMTGYGREHCVTQGREILVEIKSVNHRYFEFSARVPRAYGYLEEKLKSVCKDKISRGKIEVNVSIFNTDIQDSIIEINKSTAKAYIDALREANSELNVNDDLSLSTIIRIPDVFNVTKQIEDEEAIWEVVSPIVNIAIDKFIEMRQTEGKKMFDDINYRLDYIKDITSFIESRSPEVVNAYRSKLFNKLKDILSDNNIDEQRILTEAAIFSEKVAVDEETVRLNSHISQFKEMISLDEPVGRKLDFLVQEMNREANTIGSKAQDIETTRKVLDIKSEIEKIREQIQNIE